LQNAIEELEETRQNRDRKEANISELISRMEEAVEKINLQEQHCNKINEKLKELYTAGQDIKVQDNLISQLAEKDRMLEKQQEQLNRSRVEAVKLRQELEEVEKEKITLEKKIAAEFYEKGVPLETIREVTENTGKTALAMRKELQNAIEELEETRQNRDRKEANISELISRMEEAVEKINLQEQHCNKINEKLKELYTAGQDIKVQDNLISQLAEKDRMLEKQQEQLNRSRVEAVKLRQELEEVEKEKITLEKKIEEMEWQRKKGGQVEVAEETGALAEAKKGELCR